MVWSHYQSVGSAMPVWKRIMKTVLFFGGLHDLELFTKFRFCDPCLGEYYEQLGVSSESLWFGAITKIWGMRSLYGRIA